MSDRFDHRLEHKLKTKPDEGDDGSVVEVRRLELVSGTGRRRKWSVDEKARVVVESLVPGSVVSDVARRHGLSPQQLFAWRREARDLFAEDCRGGDASSAGAQASTDAPRPAGARAHRPVAAFAPVVLVAPAASPPGSGGSESDGRDKDGVIEIAVGAVVVRIAGRVDADTLATVLAVVRRAS